MTCCPDMPCRPPQARTRGLSWKPWSLLTNCVRQKPTSAGVSSERQYADGLTKTSAAQLLADRLRVHELRHMEDSTYQAARKKPLEERRASAYQYARPRSSTTRTTTSTATRTATTSTPSSTLFCLTMASTLQLGAATYDLVPSNTKWSCLATLQKRGRPDVSLPICSLFYLYGVCSTYMKGSRAQSFKDKHSRRPPGSTRKVPGALPGFQGTFNAGVQPQKHNWCSSSTSDLRFHGPCGLCFELRCTTLHADRKPAY